jgi:hypothetical protein
VHHGLFLGDAPGVDQALHEGVVGSDLAQFTIAEQIDARVADVGDGDLISDGGDGVDRCAHSTELGVLKNGVGEFVVCRDNRGLQGRFGVLRAGVNSIRFNNSFEGDSGCHVAACMPTHAIGNNEQV